MFNGMIAPLGSLKLAGVIWYQGESNAESSSSYGDLLTALIADWRRLFDDDRLPFIVVQLPNYGTVARTPMASGWATIRNRQQQVALGDDRVGLVVTHDVGDDADIHPRQKFIVGTRVAEVARVLEGGGGTANGVVASISESTQNAVILEFAPPLRPAENRGPVEGFSLCDVTGAHCVFAPARRAGGRVAVELDALPEADLLRFCWSDGGRCGLESVDALPVSSFELRLPARLR